MFFYLGKNRSVGLTGVRPPSKVRSLANLQQFDQYLTPGGTNVRTDPGLPYRIRFDVVVAYLELDARLDRPVSDQPHRWDQAVVLFHGHAGLPVHHLADRATGARTPLYTGRSCSNEPLGLAGNLVCRLDGWYGRTILVGHRDPLHHLSTPVPWIDEEIVALRQLHVGVSVEETVELQDEYVARVCKLGQGNKTCRFLGNDGNWACLKLTGLRQAIDLRAESGMMRARGDNCEGRERNP